MADDKTPLAQLDGLSYSQHSMASVGRMEDLEKLMDFERTLQTLLWLKENNLTTVDDPYEAATYSVGKTRLEIAREQLFRHYKKAKKKK